MYNYLIYPTKKMYISQSYLGSYSHSKNYTGTPNDYPIDESCGDNNRDYFYCPCDEVVIKRIWGVNSSGTNTIWMESTSKCLLANGEEDYVTIMVIHPNDDTLKNIKVNQKFKRKEKMFIEGNDGNATGNHFHISVSIGKFNGAGWTQNSKKGWVITGKPIKPEEAFYIDSSFTTIIKSSGLIFKNIPNAIEISPVEKKFDHNQVEVIINDLYVRDNPNGKKLGFVKIGIYDILDEKINGDYNWLQINENGWIAEKEGLWTIKYLKKKCFWCIFLKKIIVLIKKIFIKNKK